jgi:hypothetical protein
MPLSQWETLPDRIAINLCYLFDRDRIHIRPPDSDVGPAIDHLPLLKGLLAEILTAILKNDETEAEQQRHPVTTY